MLSQSATNRRAFLSASLVAVTAGGCGRDVLQETVSETPTETLQNTKIGLRGFQIVSLMVGRRVVLLPHPAVRVIGVVLLVSGAATFLLVEYLDLELKRRLLREKISIQERTEIESTQAIEFTTDNGLKEFVVIGPNRYEELEDSSDQ